MVFKSWGFLGTSSGDQGDSEDGGLGVLASTSTRTPCWIHFFFLIKLVVFIRVCLGGKKKGLGSQEKNRKSLIQLDWLEFMSRFWYLH